MEYFIYACLALFVVINVLAWKQSGGMVKIASFGKRTSKPENLSKFQKFLVLLKGVNLPCKPMCIFTTSIVASGGTSCSG